MTKDKLIVGGFREAMFGAARAQLSAMSGEPIPANDDAGDLTCEDLAAIDEEFGIDSRAVGEQSEGGS